MNVLAVCAAVAAAPAWADLFSPGELSKAHAPLSGLSNCTKCHPAGGKLSQATCLDCHKELEPRLGKGQGFHGRIDVANRNCERCHKEHEGPDARLVDWGGGGEAKFEHKLTGWALEGQHAKEKCASCHEPRRVLPPAVKALLEKRPGTKLGLGTRCTDCHFDEHRGQEKEACSTCHDARAWKPAPLFKHEVTAFALTGKHATVKCSGCHAAEKDSAPHGFPAPKSETFMRFAPVEHAACTACHFDEHRGQEKGACTACHDTRGWKPAAGFHHESTKFPLKGRHASVKCASCHSTERDTAAHGTLQPKSETFLRFVPLEHDSCTSCHKDPHAGKLGQRCTSCHDESDWHTVHAGSDDRAFHARTRYPLEGAHEDVACTACHGPFPGEPAKFKGLQFDTCTRCHVDAHEGQLGTPAPDCAACHSVQGFIPAKYGPAEHARSRYPLEGSHAAVACANCHVPSEQVKERVPAALRTFLASRRRAPLFSPVPLDVEKPLERCESCHDDAHGGQFKDKRCDACHQLSAFTTLKFDHQRDARFPLEGGHARVACDKCHAAPAADAPVRYRPLETACKGCHVDQHVGQFREKGCDSCHEVKAWKPAARFVHTAPFTDFLLDGKHAELKCASCHVEVEVAPGVKSARYKPLPRACEGCHADYHRGAFEGFAP